MGATAQSYQNHSQPTHSRLVRPIKRRLTWKDVEFFPGNPIYPGRLAQMEREWGGYVHTIVGSPAIFDNSAGAFPELPSDALLTGDGNHRRELARRHKALDEEFIADLYRGLSRADMYRRRRGLNDRRTIKPAERFLSLVEEEPPSGRTQRKIKEALEALGWEVTYERADHGLSCTNELEWIWDRDQGALVRAILTYEAVWGVREARSQARVIKGLGAFWIRYPHADPDRLVKSLKGASVEDVYRSGKSQNDEAFFIKSVYDGIRYSLAMSYNRANRKGRLAL